MSEISAVRGSIPEYANRDSQTFHHLLTITYGVIRYTTTPTPPAN